MVRRGLRQVPEFITDAVNSYVKTHRAVLCRGDSEHCPLWVSSTTRRQLTTKNLGTLISKLSRTMIALIRRRMWASIAPNPLIARETIGVDVSPHLFRTAGASSAAVYGGKNPHLASALLNHRDPRVTEEHYNRATTFSAGDEYSLITQFYREHKSGD